jgi:hypothetical protein
LHRHEVGSPLPQGSSLLPELCCLEPSSLNRPHAPHSRAHRDFTAWRLIRDAFAVRERRGDPRAVPSFRCPFLPDMPSSPTSGSSVIALSNIAMTTRSSPHPNRLDTPKHPAIRFTRGSISRLHWFAFATACRVARLPGRIKPGFLPATGDFYFQASDGSVALPAAGYDYDIDWTPMSAGLAPAGTAASFTALGWVERQRNPSPSRRRAMGFARAQPILVRAASFQCLLLWSRSGA